MTITHAKISAKSDGADNTLVQPSDWNDDHTIAEGYFLPRIATMTLTDEQIKALPTTPVQIIAAPGAGKAIGFVCAFIAVNATAGAYAGSEAYIRFTCDSSSYISNPLNMLPALTGGLSIVFPATPYLEAGTLDFDGYFLDAGTTSENEAIDLKGLGDNFTGGHASNTMKVTVIYHVIDL